MITVQNDLCSSLCSILCFSNRICCHSNNFITSTYIVSKLHDSLQRFVSCLQFLLVYHVFHVWLLLWGMRCSKLTGQVYGPKWVWTMSKVCLPEVGITWRWFVRIDNVQHHTVPWSTKMLRAMQQSTNKHMLKQHFLLKMTHITTY